MSNVSIEQAIFQAAILIADPDQRADYLDVACQGDTDLLARITELLAAEGDDDFMTHRAIDSIINQPTRPPSPEETTDAEPTSQRVGNYKLLEQIGEGGFGTVYMAEQESPVRRRVALKIIKPGMDTRQVIARFEAERQALAMMDHPNIAKVFEAGSTDQGRPYFAMELVRGVPVTDYCDANNLTTNERLKLFVDVCGAIQHAHQKGIIHRDIKPSNIMITLIDDQAIPKVIDFGIAKATQQPLTDKTIFTAYAQLIGTPTYMSPEQAQLSGNDVDTRSDVYSMGVLLYELLVGTPPFETDQLRQRGYEEMCRRIREDDPPIPSTRLSTLTRAQQATVAARRRSEMSKLRKQLRGELDWIVMKALEKDRWEDADSLAAFSGIAPVTRKSGKQCLVQRRYACPKFLRQTFHEFADSARKYCPWSRARYRMLRDRGMKHNATLRKIARSWIRILFRVWQTGIPFDCDRYIVQLQQRCPEITPYLEQEK